MELAGVTEIALILDLSRQRADQLSRQKGFPDPAAELASGRVWTAAAVMAWAKAAGRWPALAALYQLVGEAAEHWRVEMTAHAPAGDAFEATKRASERAVLVLKAELGTDITTQNRPLWALQEQLARALINGDPAAIVEMAQQGAELARTVLAPVAHAPAIPIDLGFHPDDIDSPSRWLGTIPEG